MSDFWRKAFLTVGILIAVFVMRLLFPILIVMITSEHSFSTVMNLALYHPHEYEHALKHGFPMIYGFGAGFLGMVCWHFICDPHKKIQWISWLENMPVVNFFKQNLVWTYLLPLIIAFCLVAYSKPVALAFVLGIGINGLLTWFNEYFSPTKGVGSLMKGGLIAFLYLEVLDASFSFDGVLGAFAISSNIFIIMIGLGVGAYFVRSLTIYLVRRDVLARFRYLEHGAHYAIGFLAIIMFAEIFTHVPSLLTGMVSILLIGKSTWDSRD